MTSRLSGLCLAVVLTLASGGVRADAVDPVSPAAFLQTAWSTADGLPQNTVSAILQTRDGYLWFGTYGGLVRFDGLTFTVFTVANTPELKSNRILTLYEDRLGTLWIGTELGGIARRANDAFLPALTTGTGLPSDRVFGFAEAPGGDMWIATLGGVARLHDGRTVEKYAAEHGLTQNEADAIVADGDGGFWIGAGEGLLHLRDGRIDVVPMRGFADPHVESLYRTRRGVVFIGTLAGLARLDGGAVVRLGPQDAVVHRIIEDENGDLWAASALGLLHVHDDVVTRFDARDGVVDTYLRAVAMDREGHLWLGSNVKGLARWRPRPVALLTQHDGLAARSVLPILSDRRGHMWVGAVCGGLTEFTGTRGHLLAEKDGLPAEACVLSLGEDRAGALWIGTSVGLFVLERGRIVRPPAARGVLERPRVRAIHEDRAGRLWVGAGTGLFRLDGDRFTPVTTRDGLVHNEVRCITEDRDGGLWFGTSGGASRLWNGRFTNYTAANGLSHDYVRAIYQDADGVLWLGTYGGGLNRLKDGRLSAITTKHGLTDDAVSSILEDRSGNFWMSGNRGVFRVSRRELNDVADGRATTVFPIAYGSADGMVTSETNGGAQPAGAAAPDGRLWFPTLEGVAIFDPSQHLGRVPPPVAIEQVIVDGVARAGAGSIDVPAGTRSLEIRYAGLSFTAPERMRFRYQLEGYDRAPIDAGPRRVAYYTSLPPGRYRFHVAASNNDGVWNDAGAAIALRQQPHVYQTWWFAIAALALAVTAAAGGYRLRLRQLMRRTHDLEARVAARTAEVVERSEELSRANQRLAVANTAIASARDDLLATLSQLQLGVALVEKSGAVTFLNPQARRLLDIDPDAPVGRLWHELLPLAEHERAQLQAIAAQPQSRRARLPVRVDTPSGRSYWMEIDVRDDPRDPERRVFCLYDLSEVYDLRRLLDGKAQFHGLVGHSAAMQLVVKQIRDVAGVDTTVLIEGETGVGKELVAHAIHLASARKGRPFVPVNCAGLGESLLASTLFGHRRGAFTGAVADQIGLFESGEGGTVFLDEIGDVPLPVQNSLLRVLQEKEITRVGDHRPHKIDVRIVTATHRDLAREVADGRFRQDLLYRIRVVRIQVPPLRARREDIPLLVAWFLGQARSAGRRESLEVSHEAMELLLDYSWPGNVRELKSAIDAAAIRATGTLIQPTDLPPEVLADAAVLTDAVPLSAGARRDILDALARAKGNRAAAARLLGIGRSTLYRRLRALGLDSEEPL